MSIRDYEKNFSSGSCHRDYRRQAKQSRYLLGFRLLPRSESSLGGGGNVSRGQRRITIYGKSPGEVSEIRHQMGNQAGQNDKRGESSQRAGDKLERTIRKGGA
jgi:hypothetical protein